MAYIVGNGDELCIWCLAVQSLLMNGIKRQEMGHKFTQPVVRIGGQQADLVIFTIVYHIIYVCLFNTR